MRFFHTVFYSYFNNIVQTCCVILKRVLEINFNLTYQVRCIPLPSEKVYFVYNVYKIITLKDLIKTNII